jgi:hypothetical protein
MKRNYLATLASGITLPEWAERLADECPGYRFSRQRTWGGLSVVAERNAGTGPILVITADEDEMRSALGLRARHPMSR